MGTITDGLIAWYPLDDTAEIGKFPERKKPISRSPQLTDLNSAINYNEIYEQLMMLKSHGLKEKMLLLIAFHIKRIIIISIFKSHLFFT